jgi:Holliday junction resolvasome RuvABC endonuclease subunit
MRILAIDPAGTTGWALFEDGRYLAGGIATFSRPSKAQQRKGARPGKKWLDFQEWFDRMLSEHRPDLVAIEDVRRHIGTAAAHSYGFFRYAMEAGCAKHDVSFEPLGVGEWKKVAAGKGSAKKPEVADAMTEAHGIMVFESEDHSDAVGIGHAASKRFGA